MRTAVSSRPSLGAAECTSADRFMAGEHGGRRRQPLARYGATPPRRWSEIRRDAGKDLSIADASVVSGSTGCRPSLNWSTTWRPTILEEPNSSVVWRRSLVSSHSTRSPCNVGPASPSASARRRSGRGRGLQRVTRRSISSVPPTPAAYLDEARKLRADDPVFGLELSVAEASVMRWLEHSWPEDAQQVTDRGSLAQTRELVARAASLRLGRRQAPLRVSADPRPSLRRCDAAQCTERHPASCRRDRGSLGVPARSGRPGSR